MFIKWCSDYLKDRSMRVKYKLTYASVVTYPISKTWLSKYNKIYKTALSFVHNKYFSSKDLKSSNTLNFLYRCKLTLLTLAYNCLYSSHSPSYLALSLQSNTLHNLRSTSAPLINLPTSTEYNTFADHAPTLFNCLPDFIRKIQGEDRANHFKPTSSPNNKKINFTSSAQSSSSIAKSIARPLAGSTTSTAESPAQ
jgi:hypothetical protein